MDNVNKNIIAKPLRDNVVAEFSSKQSQVNTQNVVAPIKQKDIKKKPR